MPPIITADAPAAMAIRYIAVVTNADHRQLMALRIFLAALADS
jgi:hypothetical protein